MILSISYTILYIISTIGIFSVAALVYLRQRNRLNRSFSLFTTLLGLWVLLQFLAQLLNTLAPLAAQGAFRLTLVLSAFFAVEFYLFTLRYIGRLSSTQSSPLWQYAAPAVVAVVAWVPGLLYHDVTLSEAGIVVTATVLYYCLIGFVVAYAGMGIIRLAIFMRNSRNLESRYRTKFLLAGVTFTLVIILGAILFLPEVLLSQLSIPIGLLFMVSIFGYAIVKHHLFDIRLIVVRLLAYLLSLLTVAVLYTLFAFVIFSSLLDVNTISFSQEIGFVVIAMLLALTFAPLKRFFDWVTRAIFYQDSYRPQQVLDAVGSVIVSRVEVKKLVRESLAILREALKSQFIVVVLVDAKSGSADRTFEVGKLGGHLTDAFSAVVRRAPTLVVTDELESQDANIHRVLQRSGVAVAARLQTSKDLIGYIIYGDKVNGRIYSADDINLVRLTADELAVAVQNTLRFEEIARFNSTLQEEIRQATTDLRESNKKLKSLDEAKDEFISMASHQLRTPLTSVKGYISMVLEGDAGKLSPTQQQLLEQAFASSQRMVYLISDFLNVSRLQTGKFTIERAPVVLSRIVQQEVDQLRATAASRDITLECNVPSNFPTLPLDEGKLRQAIMNFIDNAIFYSKPGGTVRVDLIKTLNDISLSVQDTGIGVPASERHSLFNKFYRATNARSVRPDGTGIGLFMAKKVVVAHGGSIIFTSTEGKGSTFGFRLPVKPLEDDSEKLK